MAQEHQNQPEQRQSEQSQSSQSESGTEQRRGMSRSAESGITREPPGFGSPFTMMRRLNEEMERFFDDFFGSVSRTGLSRGSRSDTWWPEMDVFDQDGKLVVRAELPGMKREDVQVEVRDNELCISGERRHESERTEGSYYTQERHYGSFCRTIALPTGVNQDTISATFKDGLLTVEIETPREQQPANRRVEVRDGESH